MHCMKKIKDKGNRLWNFKTFFLPITMPNIFSIDTSEIFRQDMPIFLSRKKKDMPLSLFNM